MNPLISIWFCNFGNNNRDRSFYYHQHICSKDTFHYMDFALFKLLWQWAKRRHPEKGARWIKRKYF
ncbi:MAG: hypothetical protein HGB35_03925 [Geobacteraceae bacterium]|nr:hypothetical protein [Geobacteraceae bacterium]